MAATTAATTAMPSTVTPVPPGTAALPPAPDRTLAVLESAREVLDRGWMQDGWYRAAPRPLRERLFGPLPGPDGIEAACLVAAVAVAGHAGGAFTNVDRDSGPAIDRVWEALQERRHGRFDPTRGAVAPIVRRARMRELVHWNDAPDRTRNDVLDVVDRAISRTIMGSCEIGARFGRPRSGRTGPLG